MMTEFFIAKRYLFSKKSHNVINIISIISLAGVMVGTMGLIIVLSVFNGFSGLVLSLYNSFDPDIKITAVKGKSFDISLIDTSAVNKIPGISVVSFSLEENALIKYGDRQVIGTIKGVDEHFVHVARMGDKIIDGEMLLQQDENDFAVTGGGIAYALSLSLNDPFNQLSVYIPKKGKPASVLNPEEAFNIRLIRPSGVFAIQQDFDTKYILVPLRFASDVTENAGRASAVEIKIQDGADEENVAEMLRNVTGNDFTVQTRLQQHEFLYKILRSEKWAVYFILSFILIIAIFNIIGSMTMLIIEKKKDIGVLTALGADDRMIRRIFLLEGIYITLLGAFSGMALGALVCFVQQYFGVIKLDNSESFMIDAYPVAMQPLDFVLVTGIVFVIGFLAAWYTASKISGSEQLALLRSVK